MQCDISLLTQWGFGRDGFKLDFQAFQAKVKLKIKLFIFLKLYLSAWFWAWKAWVWVFKKSLILELEYLSLKSSIFELECITNNWCCFLLPWHEKKPFISYEIRFYLINSFSDFITLFRWPKCSNMIPTDTFHYYDAPLHAPILILHDTATAFREKRILKIGPQNIEIMAPFSTN